MIVVQLSFGQRGHMLFVEFILPKCCLVARRTACLAQIGADAAVERDHRFGVARLFISALGGILAQAG
ncbi:MAG TPA: hypothetical protein VJ732_16330 [Bryobacteraceae bacterium]|nr:hypothetical protein [Bryobacteraceae bacterium]